MHALTKDLEIHFVELPKLTSSRKKNARHLERWLRYLSPKTTMEERRSLAMEDANINTAMEAEKEFVKNPICITAYEQHQKYLRDKKARESFLRKEGKADAQKEIAISMRERGMSESAIADIMKMSIEEVKLMLK